MARRARKNINSEYWHIMVQGIGREYVFPDDESKGYYLAGIRKSQEKSKVKLMAFCVMGNHAHLLLYTPSIKELSDFMARTNSDYAMYYNRRHKRVGYVFRDRFKSEAIADVEQLINCVVYIQNNPVQAGIVEKAEDYMFSSYTNYLNGRGIVDFEEAANHFDVSPGNMRQIMLEKSFIKWMEHNDRAYEEPEDVLSELVTRYNVSSNKLSDELLVKFGGEMRERCGMSYREIANLLEVGREKLRILMSIPPSP